MTVHERLTTIKRLPSFSNDLADCKLCLLLLFKSALCKQCNVYSQFKKKAIEITEFF